MEITDADLNPNPVVQDSYTDASTQVQVGRPSLPNASNPLRPIAILAPKTGQVPQVQGVGLGLLNLNCYFPAVFDHSLFYCKGDSHSAKSLQSHPS